LSKKVAYGGVLFDDEGRVLLRKPANEYDGYKWTFPKGRPDSGETPEETALREMEEETGIKARIIGKVPGSFEGGTTENFYYLMSPIEIGLPFDKETSEVRWATSEEAKELISQTVNIIGRKRDQMVLDAAISSHRKTPAALFGLVSTPIRPYAKAIHEELCKIHKGCCPRVCAANRTPYIRYAPYPDLFHLLLTQSTCRLQISPLLQLRADFDKLGIKLKLTKKWDVLAVDGEGAVEAFIKVVQLRAPVIRQHLGDGSLSNSSGIDA
jgi:8-oxo-dGTP diphosphatase